MAYSIDSYVKFTHISSLSDGSTVEAEYIYQNQKVHGRSQKCNGERLRIYGNNQNYSSTIKHIVELKDLPSQDQKREYKYEVTNDDVYPLLNIYITCSPDNIDIYMYQYNK